MGRIRTVKPELFQHERLFELEESTRLPIRVSFIGLFTQADREGRFKWRPRSLGVNILPFDGLDFSLVLDALALAGFVVKYRVDGEDYGVIPAFTEHQSINNRETDSNLPGIDSDGAEVSRVTDASARVDDATGTPFLTCIFDGPAEKTGDQWVEHVTGGSNPDKTQVEQQHNDASVTRQSRDGHAPSGEGKGREGDKRVLDSSLRSESKPLSGDESPDTPSKPKREKPAGPTRQQVLEMVFRPYAELLPALRQPVISRWDSNTKGGKALVARWREDPKHRTAEFWRWFWSAVATNPHWCGNGPAEWKPNSIGWFFERTKFDDVITLGVDNDRRSNGQNGASGG